MIIILNVLQCDPAFVQQFLQFPELPPFLVNGFLAHLPDHLAGSCEIEVPFQEDNSLADRVDMRLFVQLQTDLSQAFLDLDEAALQVIAVRVDQKEIIHVTDVSFDP